ncbi:MAG: adenylyltransferase/cytidyltransferase family protein [Elusimicrobia bacterium]|nr:adenylyltransferase/cytidyltransferase family protein [Candidatus Liberimonas magnetica]
MAKNSPSKVRSRKSLKQTLIRLKNKGKKIVFTNGCFDLLHLGHIKLFKKAKTLGDILVIGLNSDSSLKKLKGPLRPLVKEGARAQVLACLEPVDYITIFGEETPEKLIMELKPDVLVKGGDYRLNEIAGRQYVKKVYIFPVIKGYSTTSLIKKIVKVYGNK